MSFAGQADIELYTTVGTYVHGHCGVRIAWQCDMGVRTWGFLTASSIYSTSSAAAAAFF